MPSSNGMRADRTDERIVDDHHLAGLNFAHEFRAAHIERNGFGGEYGRVAELAHHERADAERIAAGDHALRRHADQRIGALDPAQRVDEAVDHRRIGRCRDEMNDTLGIAGRLEDGAATHEFLADVHRV